MVMPNPNTTLVSAEDLLTSRVPEKHVELVAGVVRRMTPAGGIHGAIAAELLVAVGNYVRERRMGRVFAAETGFILSRNPDTVRAPDVAFVSTERLPAKGLSRGFLEGGPDLAVEIMSPDDSWTDMSAKAAQYLASGTSLVWVVDPASRTGMMHYADGTSRRVDAGHDLVGDPVLPGFRYPLAALFDRD